MAVVKRSVMTLFSEPSDAHCHQVRFVLAVKGVVVDIVDVSLHQASEDLLELNPYNTLPTLVDRDVTIYQASIILEYLDERFPHPPLLPVYPVARAKCRLMMYRIEQDWYSQMNLIEQGSQEQATTARQSLTDSLTKLAPAFDDMPYFLSNDLTLVDCCIAPLLWRLPELGITLSARAKPVLDYANRVFQHEAFQASLTEAEREIREAD